MIKLDVFNDLDLFKSKEYDRKFDKIYRVLPETKCEGCGNCCYDSPNITYAEFLYAFNCIINLNLTKEEIINLYKNLIRYKILGLVEKVKCCFLGESN